MSQGRENPTVPLELHRISGQPLPLIVFRGALPLDGDPGGTCEALFAGNGWGGGWQNGIYSYHHFHATTHEVLGIARGHAKVRFGGDEGPLVEVAAGDVVVIPAGISHKKEGGSADLLVVGAYPGEREPDMQRGLPHEHPTAAAKASRVPVPATDPVFGAEGPLLRHWSGADRARG